MGLYVNWSAVEVAVAPAGVVTVTSTVSVPAGTLATILVDCFERMAATAVPNLTTVAAARTVPLMVTLSPASSPPLG